LFHIQLAMFRGAWTEMVHVGRLWAVYSCERRGQGRSSSAGGGGGGIRSYSGKYKTTLLPYVLLSTLHTATRYTLIILTAKTASRLKHETKSRTYLLEFPFRNSAYTVGAKICVSCLDASQATEVLVALLLPLGNQILVSYVLSQTVFIQFCNDTLTDISYWHRSLSSQQSLQSAHDMNQNHHLVKHTGLLFCVVGCLLKVWHSLRKVRHRW
jgi:hypothetical protein